MARPRKSPRYQPCTRCGTPIDNPDPRRQRRTCSEMCRRQANTGRPREIPLTASCITCHTSFPLDSHRRRSTCSDACLSAFRTTVHRSRVRVSRAKGPTVEIVCEVCHKVKLVFPCQASTRFCGDACRLSWFAHHAGSGSQHPNWTGGPQYYGVSWKPAKKLALIRDGYQCQRCGKRPKKNQCDVHHILPFQLFGKERHQEANDLDNLVTLCRSCHANVERGNFSLAKTQRHFLFSDTLPESSI